MIIKFRLTETEIELLEKERRGEESLDLTAARLVREKLGLSGVESDLISQVSTLRKLIKEEIGSEIGQQFHENCKAYNELVKESMKDTEKRLTQRIEALERELADKPD